MRERMQLEFLCFAVAQIAAQIASAVGISTAKFVFSPLCRDEGRRLAVYSRRSSKVSERFDFERFEFATLPIAHCSRVRRRLSVVHLLSVRTGIVEEKLRPVETLLAFCSSVDDVRELQRRPDQLAIFKLEPREIDALLQARLWRRRLSLFCDCNRF